AYPDVEQVRTEENLGPAGGYNLGMAWAMDRGYDYLLILNNDVEAHPGMLTELVRVAESDPTIGCVGPKTYYFSDRRRLASAGGIIRFKESVTRERGQGARDRGQFDRDEEVAYLNGCGMLIRREAIEAAGLWDPVFFLSVEDADWCMRAKRRGFRCVFAHRAILYHMVSDTTGVYTPAKNFQTGRSSAIFVRRYAGPWHWVTFLTFMAAALPVAWLRELRRGNQAAAVAKGRGVLAGLRAPLPAPPALEDARSGALGEAVSAVFAGEGDRHRPAAAGAAGS
ncbi:MAG TPA: glycosyltransferase family 2 protein, partial [Thermoanaerobaculia bacterium]|nr:glycosyltransferase family 2 protein [Thermoanaerobaculia bacterium]